MWAIGQIYYHNLPSLCESGSLVGPKGLVGRRNRSCGRSERPSGQRPVREWAGRTYPLPAWSSAWRKASYAAGWSSTKRTSWTCRTGVPRTVLTATRAASSSGQP